MPRIWNEWLDSVIYLYPSVEDAERGERIGGSGFLMKVKSEVHEGRTYTYAVTNRHVIEKGGTIVRVNIHEGGVDAIPLRSDDWTLHPEDDDIAAALVDLPGGKYKVNALAKEMCVPASFLGIGPGDETFMLSRFVTHGGIQTNEPVVRFGNIAMNPSMVESELGWEVLSYLVESRSLSGMSGSPVFVYIPRQEEWEAKDAPDPTVRAIMRGPYLLGIDWGHLPISDLVRDPGLKEHPDGWRVRSNSGFMAVAPASKLVSLLASTELVKQRKHLDAA